MRHFASSSFWEAYSKLPNEIRNLADKNFSLLKDNPRHPSLQFKAIRQFRSVRVGAHYRALGVEQAVTCCGSGLAPTLTMTQ